MHLTTKFLDAVALAEDRSSSPLTLVWPMPGNVGGTLLSFSAFADWRAFVFGLGLRRAVPDTVTAKFERSQKLLPSCPSQVPSIKKTFGVRARRRDRLFRSGRARRPSQPRALRVTSRMPPACMHSCAIRAQTAEPASVYKKGGPARARRQDQFRA
jgi:hypothetical protein